MLILSNASSSACISIPIEYFGLKQTSTEQKQKSREHMFSAFLISTL